MLNKDKVFLTREGYEKLEKEYRDLRDIRRPDLVERLALARSQGDLAENSEYTSAKEDLAFIDGRLNELEELINRVSIINETQRDCCQVSLGCRVTVVADKNEYVFHLVGEWEADPLKKKISSESPLGKLLLGKKIGDQVELNAPAGKIIYTIIKIE